jgi:hypothetical protein
MPDKCETAAAALRDGFAALVHVLFDVPVHVGRRYLGRDRG